MIPITFAFTAYGLRIGTARGIRILGRTAVECTRDELADNIGRDIATVAKSAPLTSGALVLDPFTGSGNTLYWMLRHLPGAHGLGLEQDPIVFQLTSRNLAILNLSIEVSNRDYKAGSINFEGSTGSIADCLHCATVGRCVEQAAPVWIYAARYRPSLRSLTFSSVSLGRTRYFARFRSTRHSIRRRCRN